MQIVFKFMLLDMSFDEAWQVFQDTQAADVAGQETWETS